MKIEIGTSWAKVSDESYEEDLWLKEYLVFTVNGGWFSDAYKKGLWDGKVHFYKPKTKLFPVGLVNMCAKAARESGFHVTVEDRRKAPCMVDESVDLGWLRPYQKQAYDRAVKYKNGILWIATGGGKTEVLSALVASLPTNWLFVVHRKNLMHDAAARIALRTGVECGKIGDGSFDLDQRVTVATFQTLVKALKGKDPKKKKQVKDFLAHQGGIIVDEAHTLGADTFWKACLAAKNAYWRIGLSGTPLDRGDKKSIYTVACLGPVIFRLQAKDLIEKGYLAQPIVRMIEHAGYSEADNWQGVYKSLVVKSRDRNILVSKMTLAAEKPSLVFVKQVEHGRTLLKNMEQCGVNASFVWGSNDTLQRDEAVKSLVRGHIDVLICSVVFQEGVDIPDLRSVVMAAGGKSKIATIQKIGRGMRKAKGKNTFEVWDVLDVGADYTERQAKDRKRTYEREGYEVEIVDEDFINNLI